MWKYLYIHFTCFWWTSVSIRCLLVTMKDSPLQKKRRKRTLERTRSLSQQKRWVLSFKMMSILLCDSRWASMKTSSYVLRTQGQSMTGSCHKQVFKKSLKNEVKTQGARWRLAGEGAVGGGGRGEAGHRHRRLRPKAAPGVGENNLLFLKLSTTRWSSATTTGWWRPTKPRTTSLAARKIRRLFVTLGSLWKRSGNDCFAKNISWSHCTWIYYLFIHYI